MSIFFVNELYFKQSMKFSNKFIYTQYRHSNKHHLYKPNANLSCFQKSTVYAAITIFNRLPLSLISLKNENTKFKVALRQYLNTHSF
jgi:hypothetical protein